MQLCQQTHGSLAAMFSVQPVRSRQDLVLQWYRVVVHEACHEMLRNVSAQEQGRLGRGSRA